MSCTTVNPGTFGTNTNTGTTSPNFQGTPFTGGNIPWGAFSPVNYGMNPGFNSGFGTPFFGFSNPFNFNPFYHTPFNSWFNFTPSFNPTSFNGGFNPFSTGTPFNFTGTPFNPFFQNTTTPWNAFGNFANFNGYTGFGPFGQPTNFGTPFFGFNSPNTFGPNTFGYGATTPTNFGFGSPFNYNTTPFNTMPFPTNFPFNGTCAGNNNGGYGLRAA